jgi:hypothetical protein
MLQFNPVMAARYQAMTQAAGAVDDQAAAGSRQASTAAAARARRARVRVACAVSLLRWIYVMVVHDTSWDPAAAAGQHAARYPAQAA